MGREEGAWKGSLGQGARSLPDLGLSLASLAREQG